MNRRQLQVAIAAVRYALAHAPDLADLCIEESELTSAEASLTEALKATRLDTGSPVLSYWLAKRVDDSQAYSIRAKTKREAQGQLRELKKMHAGSRYAPEFEPLELVERTYRNAFDLALKLLQDPGRY